MAVTRSIPHLTPEVELIGDWKKCKKLIRLLPDMIRVGTLKGQKSASKLIMQTVKRNIRNNGGSLGWKPLSLDYQYDRALKGYTPDDIYYASGRYYNNIKVWKKGNTYYVGLRGHIKPSSNRKNMTLGMVARILEYGSAARSIPARPLWYPSFIQFGGTDRVKRIIIRNVRNEIHKMSGTRVRISL